MFRTACQECLTQDKQTTSLTAVAMSLGLVLQASTVAA